MKAQLKICGMRVPANIAEAIALQPAYMGFLMYPGSKRFIADLDAATIISIPADIKTTGVFVNEELEAVKKAIDLYHFKAVQLHGNESPDYCMELQGKAEVIKAFGIDETFDFSTLEAYADAVDYFLFDTQTPEHGGSGKAFNWHLLENYTLQKSYFLSGGIGLANAPGLLEIRDERFYAIDVNSRFEQSPGLKDIARLTEFKKLLGC
ncbi:phosphoribosylanthranilate isomerase [Pedobacter hartonius]|uniref:N-(5'-phosphoribosyl)anthranilate isomerase n=1 Tax=Pedobacter hartonius TaxID=425514 RepID=A0A1H4CE92_9SPHI|nr:phosphoribosylanthranilate isomerase [Pedobacter hartonius]SEA58694.1 phosphoribosylanthranilate isomerase [Pedobacter hartonius]